MGRWLCKNADSPSLSASLSAAVAKASAIAPKPPSMCLSKGMNIQFSMSAPS